MDNDYVFKAVDAYGRRVVGTLKAPDALSAQRRLARIYVETLFIHEQVAPKPKTARYLPVSAEDLAVYTRQLAVMIHAGIPIHRSLRFLTLGESAPMNLVLLRLAACVEEGKSLSTAMEEQGGVFNEVYVALVRAGEKTGRLEQSLRRLADLMEKVVAMKRRLTGTFAYPAAVAAACCVIVGLFAFYVIPMLVPMFESLGVELPLATRILVWLTKPPALAVLTLLVFMGWRQLRNCHLYRLPWLGELVRLSAAARVLYTMSTLLDSGVVILDAMLTLKAVAGLPELSDRLERARRELLDGVTLHRALRGALPEMALQMIKVGEETGRIPELVRNAARLYEEEVDHKLERLSTILEPLIMGCMGLVVGFLIMAAMLPLIHLLRQL